MKNLLMKLCSISSISGQENAVCEFIKKNLDHIENVKIENDNSVIASLGPEKSKKHILLDAHLDHIGLIVLSVTKSGFINFATCGGFDPKILCGKIVTVHAKVDIKGVICTTSPHLQKRKEKNISVDDLFIDVGLEAAYVKDTVSAGNRISINCGFFQLLNNNISSASTDNAAGVAALIKLSEKLAKEALDKKITILFSSREEIGLMGAKISTYKIKPSEAICVDVSFAQQPKVSNSRYAILGNGPLIGVAPSLSLKITNSLKKAASLSNISYQIEVMSGKSGTNADVISVCKSGVPCGLVSIPQRYMHTGVEVVNLQDIENTIDLLFSYVTRIS